MVVRRQQMIYDTRYTIIAHAVLNELQRHKGEIYTAPFTKQVDIERLGIAIQRAELCDELRNITQLFEGELPSVETLFPLTPYTPNK
jgi:hypothetical protein